MRRKKEDVFGTASLAVRVDLDLPLFEQFLHDEAIARSRIGADHLPYTACFQKSSNAGKAGAGVVREDDEVSSPRFQNGMTPKQNQ